MFLNEETLRKLKESGSTMTTVEKILFLRMTEGLSLKDARDHLLNVSGGYFDGPWTEFKKS